MRAVSVRSLLNLKDMLRSAAHCRGCEPKTAYGGRDQSLLPLLVSLLCWGLLLSDAANAASSGTSLQYQMTSSQQQLPSATEEALQLSSPPATEASSSIVPEVTLSSSMLIQSTSLSTAAGGGVVPSSAMTFPQSTSLSTTRGGGEVSITPPPTLELNSEATMSASLQPSLPTILSTSSSMSPSTSLVPTTPASTGGTTAPPSTPDPFFTEQVIFIFIIASGTVAIVILLVIMMAGLLCCCYLGYRRCKRHQVALSPERQTEHFHGCVTVNKTAISHVGSKESLSRIEMTSMTECMRFDTPQYTPGDSQLINGGSQCQPRGSHLNIPFYPDMKETATSSALLSTNPNTIGPTEDFRDNPPVEDHTLTQESVNSRIVDHALPERSEYVHADIKAQQEQREVAEKGQEEGLSHQHQVESPMSPTSPTQLQLPQKVTTLSKKQASMVDLSMITMIKNEYFEDPGSPLARAEDSRDHMAAGRLEDATSSLEVQALPEKRKRTSTLDLGALTSLTSSSMTQNDTRPSAERPSDDQSLVRRTSQSMANLSYGGEADIESDRDARKTRSPKKANRRADLPRASSMLEELTSIGSPSRHTVDTLVERSQEADSDSPPESSMVNRDPPLKSILKNSGSRQNLVTRSSLNLHDADPYTPPLPRIPRPIRPTATTPLEGMTPLPLGAYLTQEPRSMRRSTYDGPTNYTHFPIFNAHLDSPPINDMRDRDGFWGRPVYGYYDTGGRPDMLAARRERYMGY